MWRLTTTSDEIVKRRKNKMSKKAVIENAVKELGFYNQVLFTLNELDSIIVKCQETKSDVTLLDVMNYLKKQR